MFVLQFFDGREPMQFAKWWDGFCVVNDLFRGGELDNGGRVFDSRGAWIASYFDSDSGPPSAELEPAPAVLLSEP